MKLLASTLDDPLSELVYDEILLGQCDAGDLGPCLRFWESKTNCVVVGYGNQADKEVDFGACRELGLPVYRRCTGGGTVMIGPGSLNYSLLLPISFHAALETVVEANEFIMSRNQIGLSNALEDAVVVRGCTDLAIADMKFSGNAQRRRRTALLFHGTILLDLDLSLMARVLRSPSREPRYRNRRSHEHFVANLDLARSVVTDALAEVWNVNERVDDFSPPPVRELVCQRRKDEKWVILQP